MLRSVAALAGVVCGSAAPWPPSMFYVRGAHLDRVHVNAAGSTVCSDAAFVPAFSSTPMLVARTRGDF